MVRRGCRVALGLDGATLDEDDDALRELRLAHLLHRGSGFKIDVSRAAMLTMMLRNGRRSVTNRDDGGVLAAGEPADILLLDWNALDDERLRSDLDPRDLLFARATSRHIREVIVAGRTVVRDGEGPRRRLSGDARRIAGAAARRDGGECRPRAGAASISNVRWARTLKPSAPCC